MADHWMIYGANGYTGELVARLAAARGERPILAGRTSGPVARLAMELGLPHRVFDLRDPAGGLRDVDVVAHCAGPFAVTSAPMVAACLATGTHYLDVTGEPDVFEAVFARHADAVDAGVVLLPGAGFDVVPTDCLAALLHARLPDAVSLELAFRAPGGTSRGTARTGLRMLPAGALRRVGGQLRPTPFGTPSRSVPFPSGERRVGAITWGDLVTAHRSTGIGDITVYTRAPAPPALLSFLLRYRPVRALASAVVGRRPPGPSAAVRAATSVEVWGSVRNAAGDSREATLVGPNAYDLTADAVVRAVGVLRAGEVPPGAHTPATALGADFVQTLNGVRFGSL